MRIKGGDGKFVYTMAICLVVGMALDVGAREALCGAPIGPDVIVSQIHVNTANWSFLDPSGTGDYISAFSLGTTSCNIGDDNLDWFPSTGSNQHPVIAQGVYRLLDGQFEQIGMSWLKHGFFAVNDASCGHVCTAPEPNPPGTWLYVGCSDPYTASLNGDRNYMGPTFEVNAHTGFFPARHSPSNASTNIASRLQVHNTDIDPALNVGALYFGQTHYVHPDDALFDNDDNNASFVRVGFSHPANTPAQRFNMSVLGGTQLERSAIRAWKDNDPAVVETDVRVPNEGLFILATRVTDLGSGFHRYEYALQNLNSDRGGASFRVPLPEGVVLENIGFHDVDYHSGDGVTCLNCTCVGGSMNTQPCEEQADCPNGSCVGNRQNFDGTDWAVTVVEGSITWATTPYAADPNANALRWSTLYNFRFDANIHAEESSLSLGLFKPGFPSDVTIRAPGPALAFIDCNQNSVADNCDVNCAGLGCEQPCGGSADCNTNGVPDECEADCNNNEIADPCDLRDGTSEDCNENTVPDECESDCDEDGIIDDCELINDIDQDGVLDCDDQCPETTPQGGCLPPFNQIVACCYSTGILLTDLLTWNQCFATFGAPVCDRPPVCPGTPCPESRCRFGCLVGDFDRDGDVDLFDAGMFEVCYSGPEEQVDFTAPSAECLLRFDFDNDGDVDASDFGAFRIDFAGP